MRMYVYIYKCVLLYRYLFIYSCIYVCIYIYVQLCMCIYVNIYIYVYVYICTHIFSQQYPNICLIYIYIYIYIPYIYIFSCVRNIFSYVSMFSYSFQVLPNKHHGGENSYSWREIHNNSGGKTSQWIGNNESGAVINIITRSKYIIKYIIYISQHVINT